MPPPQAYLDIADLTPLGGLASDYLQLWFADAAQAFMPSTGIRGGAHNRAYRTAAFFAPGGATRAISWLYGWWDSPDTAAVDAILAELPQMTLFATSEWQPLPVISAAAKAAGEEFIYVSRRLGDTEPCSQSLGPVDPQGTRCANHTCTKLPCKPCVVCHGRPTWSECDTLVAPGTVVKQEFMGAGRRYTLGAIMLDQQHAATYGAGIIQNHQVGAFFGGANPAGSRLIFGDAGSTNCSAAGFQRHSYGGITSRLVAGAMAVARPRLAKINGCPKCSGSCPCRTSDFPLFAYASSDLYATKTEAGDWVCFNAANETYACLGLTGGRRVQPAPEPCASSLWDGHLLLFNGSSTTTSIGVLQTGTAAEHGTFAAFVTVMGAKRMADATDPSGNLRYTTLRGEELAFGVGGVIAPIDLNHTYLSPYISARRGGKTVVTLSAPGHPSASLEF